MMINVLHLYIYIYGCISSICIIVHILYVVIFPLGKDPLHLHRFPIFCTAAVINAQRFADEALPKDELLRASELLDCNLKVARTEESKAASREKSKGCKITS